MNLGIIAAAGFPFYSDQTTLSPTNKAADIVLSDSDTRAESTTGAGGGVVLSVAGKTTGKFYFEVEVDQVHPTLATFGAGVHRGTSTLSNYLGQDTNGWGLWDDDSSATAYAVSTYLNASATSYGSGSLATKVGRRICCAIDVDNGEMWLGEDFADGATRTWDASGSPDPATGTDPSYSFTTGATFYIALCPAVGDIGNPTDRNRLHLIDPNDWRYSPPSGFGVWIP